MPIGDTLFSFHGRTRRQTYWVVLPILAVFNLIARVLTVIGSDNRDLAPAIFVGGLVFGFTSLWIALAIYVKRWHDTNRSGWMSLTLLIPLVNIAVVFILGFLPGTDGPNKYGQDPTNWSDTAEVTDTYAPSAKTTCDQCGKSFPSHYYLEKSQDGQYRCEECRRELAITPGKGDSV